MILRFKQVDWFCYNFDFSDPLFCRLSSKLQLVSSTHHCLRTQNPLVNFRLGFALLFQINSPVTLENGAKYMRSTILEHTITSGPFWITRNLLQIKNFLNMGCFMSLNKCRKLKYSIFYIYIHCNCRGKIVYSDLTWFIEKYSYFPSYNIPFFKEITEISGFVGQAAKLGDWFKWGASPRAKIFDRDHVNVRDLDTLNALMRLAKMFKMLQ